MVLAKANRFLSRNISTQTGFIFFLAFVVRMVFILFVAERFSVLEPGLSRDEGLDIARNLLNGEGYVMEHIHLVYRSFRPPVFPLLLAAILGVFGERLVAYYIFSALLSSITCVLVFLIARRIYDRKVAFLAGLITAIYPPLIFWNAYPGPESLIALILALICYLLLIKERKTTHLVAIGLLVGMAVLTRSLFLTLPAVVVLWLFLNNEDKRRAIREGLTILAITLITVTPWVVRNLLTHNALVLASTDGGMVFYICNNLETLQTISISPTTYVVPSEYKDNLAELQAMGEVERDRWFYKRGLQDILSAPSLYGRMVIQRLRWLWNLFPQGAASKASGGWVMGLGVGLALILTHIFAAIGTVASRNQWRQLSLFLILLLQLTLLSPLIRATARYRVPLEPYVAIFAAVGLIRVWKTFRSKIGIGLFAS